MPLCGSVWHAASGLPALLPPAMFLRARPQYLMNHCRHCHRVKARMRVRYGGLVTDPACVRLVWQHYWQDQRQAEQKASMLPHQRWCSRGHIVTAATFHPFPRARQSGYCHDCHAIYQLQHRHLARHGVLLTWQDAAGRHFLASQRRSRRMNAKAPPGQRWCAACQQYYVIPLTWTRTARHSFWRCPPCCAVYFRQKSRQRSAKAPPRSASLPEDTP